jgi:L-ascorbate metabolism protein UlaG (beta-lactamase superfamily)
MDKSWFARGNVFKRSNLKWHFLILLTAIVACATMSERKAADSHVRNEKLPVVLDGYPGNVLDGKVFREPDHEMDLSFARVMKWKLFSSNPQSKEKKNDPYRLPVVRSPQLFEMKEDMLVWLGQASFFVRIDGKTLLLDPVIGDTKFNKRLCDRAVETTDIKGIDYLLVSHTHFDHLDSDTIADSNLSGTMALLPLRMGGMVSGFNPSVTVEEAGWFQKYDTDGPEVYFLPARHWSRRSLTDTNKVLWGSYVIKGKNSTIYFAGDTAYGAHFAQIAELFPKIDIALMPIGAYKPDYIMKQNHLSPDEAAKASNDLKAKVFIPMHYGTFDLSDEPLGEPLRRIQEISSAKGLDAALRIIQPGEILFL